MTTGAVAARMRFSVDTWDPGYGTSLGLDDDLDQSSAQIAEDIELPPARWRPIDPALDVPPPSAILFVDGVRRIEARAWIDEATTGPAATEASMALCASYAAGVVCCCPGRAHLVDVAVRRGLFSTATQASDVTTTAGVYRAHHTAPRSGLPQAVTLSVALQAKLAEVELVVAQEARHRLAGHGFDTELDLLVVDGPLRGRTHLPRALGYIKTHRSSYLSSSSNAVVGTLRAGQRTPVFRMGTTWERYSWYLRLPCAPGSPWAGVVRIECSADVTADVAIGLARLSQATLPRHASVEYKDTRAPQNLYPIAGLERQLRRRLGDPGLLYRALRVAAR